MKFGEVYTSGKKQHLKSLGKKISEEGESSWTHWGRKCLVFSLKFLANSEGNNKSL